MFEIKMYRILFCIKMMFSIFLLCLLADFVVSSAEEADIGLTICDGPEWVKFKDEKCYKLIKKWSTRNEAQELCSKEVLQMDSSIPQLATIKTPEEHDYLADYIFNISEVMINVWIGAKRQNANQFVWDDGSDVEFSNWIEGGPSDRPERGCVEMLYQFARKRSDSDSGSENLRDNGGNGKWRDVTCGLPNYVVCEKLQRWSFGKLQHSFIATRKEMYDSFELVSKELDDTNGNLKSTQNQLSITQSELSNTKNQLSSTQNQLSSTQIELSDTKSQLTATQNQLSITQQNPVPIGFIYVQLPNQPEPKSIWPMVEWIQVTSNYAGQFFRAEGGGSLSFGSNQGDNAPRLTGIEFEYGITRARSITVNAGATSDWICVGGTNREDGLKFTLSGGEVRPRNTAIRIWKRTK